jgi:gamma-glutamylaminecyclotransferase
MSKPFSNRRHPERRPATRAGERRITGKGRRPGCRATAVRAESPEMPVVTRLFVCESLMAGERHHDLLGTARRVVAQVRTKPAFRLLDKGGGADLAADGQIAVLGEVYEVDAPTLASLDASLGHPRFYVRTNIELEDGTTADAYLTHKAGRHELQIEAGDWRAREETCAKWAVRAGDHEIIGTRLEIVRALQALLLDGEGFSTREYIDWVVMNAREHMGIELDVHGETDEELADSYLKAMLRADLIRRC